MTYWAIPKAFSKMVDCIKIQAFSQGSDEPKVNSGLSSDVYSTQIAFNRLLMS